MLRCVYVSQGWGVHDERWTSALRNLGFSPIIIRLGMDARDVDELRSQVSEHSAPDRPILAGPLDSVTKYLTDIPAPVVGLSWGFDLHGMSDMEWLPRLHGLIVDSEATAAIAQDTGVRPEAITFLPWGVDLSMFSPHGPSADLTAWGIPSHARTLVSLRAHEPMYRVADIVDAFAAISSAFGDVHLLVGHTGSLTEQLRARAEGLGIVERVHFIGTVAEDELPALLRAADAYVSASEVDGTSVTLLQAMACTTPVIASGTAGNRPWVIPGQTGYLFATGDPRDLAARFKELLTAELLDLEALTARGLTAVREKADWAGNLPRLARALSTK